MLMAILGLIGGAFTLYCLVTLGGLSLMATADEKRRNEAARIEEGRAAAERVRRSEPTALPSPIDRFLAG